MKHITGKLIVFENEFDPFSQQDFNIYEGENIIGSGPNWYLFKIIKYKKIIIY